MLEIVEIRQKILDPEGRALSDGRRLRGLEMGKRESREILVSAGKIREDADGIDQFPADQPKAFRHEEDVGVVPHIAGRCPQVDNRFRVRTLDPVGVHVRHHVVAHDLFTGLCHIVIDIVPVGLHLGNLLFGDGKAQFLFRLRERDPEPSPGPVFLVGGKEVFHFSVRVPGRKRGLITIFQGKSTPPLNVRAVVGAPQRRAAAVIFLCFGVFGDFRRVFPGKAGIAVSAASFAQHFGKVGKT